MKVGYRLMKDCLKVTLGVLNRWYPPTSYSCQTGPSVGCLWLPCPSSRFLPPPGAPPAPAHQSAGCSHTWACLLFLPFDLCSQANRRCQTILSTKNHRQRKIYIYWWNSFIFKNVVTLLNNDGPSFFCPAFTMPPLIIRLIHRACSHLMTEGKDAF